MVGEEAIVLSEEASPTHRASELHAVDSSHHSSFSSVSQPGSPGASVAEQAEHDSNPTVTAEVRVGTVHSHKHRRASSPDLPSTGHHRKHGSSHHHHSSKQRSRSPGASGGHHHGHHGYAHHHHHPNSSSGSSNGSEGRMSPERRRTAGAPFEAGGDKATRRSTKEGVHHPSPLSNAGGRAHGSGPAHHAAVSSRTPSFTTAPRGGEAAARAALTAFCKGPTKRPAEAVSPVTIAKGFASGWLCNRQLLVLQAGNLAPGLLQQVAQLSKHPALALVVVQPPGTRGWAPMLLGACGNLQLWVGSLVHDDGSFGPPEQLSSYRLLMDMQRRGFSLRIRYRHLKHENDYHDKLAQFDFPLNSEDGGIRAPQLPGGASLTDYPVVNLPAHELYTKRFGALLPATAGGLKGLLAVQEH